MDYTILLSSLRAEFGFPPSKVSAVCFGVHSRDKIVQNNTRGNIAYARGQGVQCKRFPDMKKGAPKFCGP